LGKGCGQLQKAGGKKSILRLVRRDTIGGGAMGRAVIRRKREGREKKPLLFFWLGKKRTPAAAKIEAVKVRRRAKEGKKDLSPRRGKRGGAAVNTGGGMRGG